MARTTYSIGRTLIGTVARGEDLLGRITAILNEEKIELGRVEVYGSVEKLTLERHDQGTGFGIDQTVQAGCDIVSLSGPISLFKRRALPRLHGLFVETSGTLHGGMVAPGTVIHACEVVITEYTGGKITRDFDQETGLPLWTRSEL